LFCIAAPGNLFHPGFAKFPRQQVLASDQMMKSENTKNHKTAKIAILEIYILGDIFSNTNLTSHDLTNTGRDYTDPAG
jgi:hypothetical protein